MKKVPANGVVTLHEHYLYRGYLQIAAIDLMRANAPTLWLLHWDPTEQVATRPLSLRKNGTWYTYGHDLTKNVMELYTTAGAIVTEYDYTPYGAVTATGLEQPIQWSSEHYDTELGMVYYNYRHYNPLDGRWINRDPIAEEGGRNLYGFVGNRVSSFFDRYGFTSNEERKCIVDFLQVYELVRNQELPLTGEKRLIGAYSRQRGGVVNSGNSTIQSISADGNKTALFTIDAKFIKDDCDCCEYRQFVKWEEVMEESPAFSMDINARDANDYIEDRDWFRDNSRYGKRVQSGRLGYDAYYDVENRTKIHNQLTGQYYSAHDAPVHVVANGITHFKATVWDVCRNMEVPNVAVEFAVDWSNRNSQ